MISGEDTKLIQRVQTLGRALVTNLYQLFRSAEIYEENNEIFRRIADSMRNHIEESFRYLNSCNLKVSNHNIYISGNRIFIDYGILESVRALSKIFEGGTIGGMMFLEDCLEKQNLIRGLLAFRETLVVDQRKGVDGIKKGMIERHTPFVLPIKEDEHEIRVSGLRDEIHAKQFALKNAIKFMIFLENMHKSYQTGVQVPVTIIYRVTLNLIRIFENFPNLAKTLIYMQPPNPAIREQFTGGILMMIVLAHIKVERQFILNVVVDSLFHSMAKMTEPTQHFSPEDTSLVGARRMLETRFINRSFFFRVNFAYHTPLKGKDTQDIDFTRLFKTIQIFLGQIHSMELVQTAIVNLLKTHSAEVHKPSVLLIAQALGLLNPGQTVVLDGKKPAIVGKWQSESEEAELQIKTINPVHTSHKETINWSFSGEREWMGYLKRLAVPSQSVPHPNPVQAVFK